MVKKILIFCVAAVAAWFVFLGGSGPKDTAKDFLESMFVDADAKKCVSFMSDEFIEWSAANYNAKTEKVFISQFEKKLEKVLEDLEKSFGTNVECKVEIIDVYEYTPPENWEYMSQFEGEEMVEVAYELKYSGRKLLTKKTAEESGELQLVKRDGDWYVAYLK